MSTPRMTALNLNSAVRIAIMAARAGVVPCFMGPPGIGKSAAIGPAVAKAFDMADNLNSLEVAHGDESELIGIRALMQGAVKDVALTQIANVCSRPGVLFLDEINRNLQRQGLILPLLDRQRRIGSNKLNEDSVIIAAGNYTTSGGAEPFISALASRIMQVDYLPSVVDDILPYLSSLGAPNSELRVVAEDVCLTIERRTALMQVEPPAGAEEDGATWANPRQWENAIRFICEAHDPKDAKNSATPEELMAGLGGLLGMETATGFLAIRRLRTQLPSAKEIAKNPTAAVVPSTPDLEVALLGLLPAALRESSMSWAYIARLSPEIRAVARRLWMTKYPGTDAASRKAMTAAVAV